MAIDWKLAETVKTENEKVPIHRYHKTLIKTGKYIKDSDGLDFEVTEDLLKHWANTVQDMNDNGVKIPVPLGHTDNPEKNKGFLTKAFEKDGSLISVIDLIGDDAEELSKTQDVSIFVPPKFVDGKGNTYARPIRHVALTPFPVIPGLGEFEAVAASLSSKENKMAFDFSKIKSILGIEGDVSETNAEGLIMGAIKKLKDRIPKTLSFNETTLAVATENRELKLSQLVSAAKITPAVSEELKKAFVNKEAIVLSLSSEADDPFSSMIKALEKNEKVISTGENTGAQNLELGDRRKENEGESVVLIEAKRRAKEAAAV